jgi:hypothetical protein
LKASATLSGTAWATPAPVSVAMNMTMKRCAAGIPAIPTKFLRHDQSQIAAQCDSLGRRGDQAEKERKETHPSERRAGAAMATAATTARTMDGIRA